LAIKRNKEILNRTIQNYYHKATDNWFIFCIFYLEASKKLIEGLPEKDDELNNFDEERAIIVPTIYTFKHTLELILKYISISLNPYSLRSLPQAP
jgi:hypothetical protein